MKMTLQQLSDAIEAFPKMLGDAVGKEMDLERKVEKLDEQIEEEELSIDVAAPEEEPQEDGLLEFDRKIMETEQKIAKLELEYEQAKGEVELEYRRNPPAGDKVTEATVAAVLKSDPKLLDLKRKTLDAKLEKDKFVFERNTKRRETNQARRDARWAMRMQGEQTETPIANPKLEKLREKKSIAEVELFAARARIEEIRASITSYQLLVTLYTSGLMK